MGEFQSRAQLFTLLKKRCFPLRRWPALVMRWPLTLR